MAYTKPLLIVTSQIECKLLVVTSQIGCKLLIALLVILNVNHTSYLSFSVCVALAQSEFSVSVFIYLQLRRFSVRLLITSGHFFGTLLLVDELLYVS